MTRKLLQWLGVAFVLALVGGSAGALVVVKDRVRLVLQDDAVATGPEPVALLRDDVGVLARELGELRAALAANFEQLGSALEARAEARHADVRALAAEVAVLRQRLEAQVAVGQRTEQWLAQWQDRLTVPAAAAVAGAPAAPPVEPPVAPPVAPLGEAPVAPPVAPPAVPMPEPAAPAAKPKGFLSFSLPTAAFRFDALQTYQLVPELCRVGFDAKSTLHDFSGVTSRVTGRFTADFDDPAGAWRGEVSCEAATLVTGVDGRDANLREHLATQEHPAIRFEVDRFVPAPGGIDVGKQTARGEIVGRMTIRGVTRELHMPVSVAVDPSRRVVIEGQTPLRLSDYGVPVPSQLGVINMQDEVVVWIALRARVQPEAAK